MVVFSFFFCWSPFHSQRLMFVLVTLYGSWTKTLTSAQHILFIISGSFQTFCNNLCCLNFSNLGVFYYFNSALNPILYSLMSKRFRRGFSDIKRNLLKKMYQIPTSHHSEGNRSIKLESPCGRPRFVSHINLPSSCSVRVHLM